MTASPQQQERRAVCDFAQLTVDEEPFPHVTHPNFIESENYLKLAESFPACPASTGPTGHSLYWGDANYQKLLDTEAAWQQLFETFHSQTFIDWAREQFATRWENLGCLVDLSKARYVPYREDRVDKELPNLRVVEHAPEELWVRLDIHQGKVGYGRGLHVDHRRRLLSMLIYFCDQQEIRMQGGELLLHDSTKRAMRRVPPKHNLMVAFPCAASSTHSVTTVSSLAAPRNYVQIHISSSINIWNDHQKLANGELRSDGSRRHFSFGPPVTAAVTAPPDAYATSADRLNLEESRAKLLATIKGARNITVIRNQGNIGDQLIHAGMRRLMGGIDYREISLWRAGAVRGEVAIITGSGAWCEAHQHLPELLPGIEKQFDRVIVFPTSFDTNVKNVHKILSGSRALVFAREFASYNQIRDLCLADVAHDTAFFFDFAPYRRQGDGTLLAFRTDGEASTPTVPAGNNDIATTCESLDEFLWTIARYAVVKTDRAHVMIAAALLGKEVEFSASSYHKVPALAAASLHGYPVTFVPDLRVTMTTRMLNGDSARPPYDAAAEAPSQMTEYDRVKALADERGRVLAELLNSKSYRIVSAYWRLRRYLSGR